MDKMKKEETEAVKMNEDKGMMMKGKKPMAQVEAPTFENVETSEASLVEATVTNEIETTRASIAGWLEGVLATNKKK
jgi:hypothetical protein